MLRLSGLREGNVFCFTAELEAYRSPPAKIWILLNLTGSLPMRTSPALKKHPLGYRRGERR